LFGKSGTVLYWSVARLPVVLDHFEEFGTNLYRVYLGPIDIENGISISQVEDPFGNLIGIRGTNTSPEL
jgi:hypothetical protein